ncbi:hypothetical protein GCM10017559_76620 [Streptosporangium longisporum]|uniref:MHYT domain-containing protein n=1 Tax=Streptosporangium longisporum TaxID=46187 RepID=A0ABP6LA53_9ACTN
MSPIDHFAYGLVTPVASYIMSSIGSLLGLLLAARARGAQGGSRALWLIGAALSIGGPGIWVMHFIAMMGFDVRGTSIRLRVPLTVASALSPSCRRRRRPLPGLAARQRHGALLAGGR